MQLAKIFTDHLVLQREMPIRVFGTGSGTAVVRFLGEEVTKTFSEEKWCVELSPRPAGGPFEMEIDLNGETVTLSDILIGNEEDYQLCLGLKGPEAGGKDLGSKIDSFKKMIMDAHAAYPNVKVFATTLRQVIAANQHLWGAISFDGEKFNVIEPRPIYVYDRIGGGDGFVGGLLYGLLKDMSVLEATEFGWATGAYTATCETDYGMPANEDIIWSIYSGDARVKR